MLVVILIARSVKPCDCDRITECAILIAPNPIYLHVRFDAATELPKCLQKEQEATYSPSVSKRTGSNNIPITA